MATEQQLRARLTVLRAQAKQWDASDRGDEEERQSAGGWLASALSVIEALVPNPQAPHRRLANNVVGSGAHQLFFNQVGTVDAVLGALDEDLAHGMFASVVDEAFASGFESLLSHAADYLQHRNVGIAGVVGGVAFEDAMRRIREIQEIEPHDINLEDLIAELTKRGVFNAHDARQARAAAAVRTSATHARWDEFNEFNVQATINFTQQIVTRHLLGRAG